MSHPGPYPTYPEPDYAGESGELSATLRRADTPPDLTYPHGGTVDYLATGGLTAGEFGLYRWNFSGPRTGPDPHFHRTISESFFILSGTVTVYDGTEWREVTAGDYLFVPKGGIHGFKNESGLPASMLLLFTPGAPRESYFETLDQLARGLVMSDEEKDAFYLAHDNHGW